MSLWQSVVLPAVGGGSGISAFGALALRFIKNQAEDVVGEAVAPIAADMAAVKEDVAYIKGNLGLPKS